MKEAARTRTCLEVNSNFHRLDLNDMHCRKAREMGVHVIISTDSHNYDDLLNLPYGVATAQRGWIEKDRVLNARACRGNAGLQRRKAVTSAEIKAKGKSLGFDLVGIAPIGPFPESAFYPKWLENGYAGEMQYLERQKDAKLTAGFRSSRSAFRHRLRDELQRRAAPHAVRPAARLGFALCLGRGLSRRSSSKKLATTCRLDRTVVTRKKPRPTSTPVRCSSVFTRSTRASAGSERIRASSIRRRDRGCFSAAS